jgi:YD repeat-containing protein
VLRQGDVSGDGLLASAEIARLLRGAAWVLAVQEGATQDVLVGAVGAGALAGILSARLLVESLDYDGDGRLSAAELTQDRAAGFARATGTPEGRPLRTDGLTEGAGMLRGLMEGLLGR